MDARVARVAWMGVRVDSRVARVTKVTTGVPRVRRVRVDVGGDVERVLVSNFVPAGEKGVKAEHQLPVAG